MLINSINMKPKVIVLTGNGINGEREMAQAFIQAGADTEMVHINDLAQGHKKLDDYQILAFPGGFAYGDDLGAGIAMANRLRNNIWEQLMTFTQKDKLVMGICNGFQMMVNLGILPGFEGEMGMRKVALRPNASNRYQCRWVNVKSVSTKCVFTKNIGVLPLSVGHGEGNFFAEETVLDHLAQNDQIALQYCNEAGAPADGLFPLNPNGAARDIAGICDSSGRIFGLMPHPDRFLTAYNQANWTLLKEKAKRAGKEFSDKSVAQVIYENGVGYFG